MFSSIFRHKLAVINAIYSFAQTWAAGDNSTVEGCSNRCSVEDNNLKCWNSASQFYEQTLLGSMRSYISILIGIDQWHRRHGLDDGINLTKIGLEKSRFLSGFLEEDDVLDSDVLGFMRLLTARAQNMSTEVLSSIPHYQCPFPCEYRHDMYRNLFIASMVLNVCLLLTVVPFVVKLMRQENEWAKETLIPTRR
ncbi:unnamed protein product [Caenorhabditis auriculariae]|uniref:Uncharacterized protein n=1 Tax=Caenorhabditis auriculariae TaxID=2777116 RepID=A0A8S1GYG6_9PELO|nr:unnamed protein product [Caenorhabditis auriculariae]